MSAELAHCAATVRRHDYDRYLCALFAAPLARRRLVALYAFNFELARVRETVSEPALGGIRLQWWRESLDGVYRGAPRAHPVAQAMAALDAASWLPRDGAEALIDARARDLDDAPFADPVALAGYVDATAVAVVELALAALGACTDAAPAAGRAWGYCGLARAAPFRNRPLLRCGGSVRELAARAASHLADLPRRSPRAALPALLPASLARLYLARLERADYVADDPSLRVARAVRQWRAVAHWLVGRP